MDVPNTRLINQRIRNRIIEWCEWCIEFETSDDQDLEELIFTWDDWWAPREVENYMPPVFSHDELGSLMDVDSTCERFLEATKKSQLTSPKDLPEILALDEWKAWQEAASYAHKILMERGKLSEELEIPS